MSPAQRAERFVVAIDLAESRAAAAGRGIADAAEDLDSVARRLAGEDAADGGWAGLAGSTARGRVAEVSGGVGALSGACLYLADVLRVEGSRLARTLISWGDAEQVRAGEGDVTAVRDADRALSSRLREAADSLAGYTDAATAACIDLAGSTDNDPRAVAALWHSLGPSERERLVRDHPELGSEAGVSSATRDALNRTRLRRLLEGVATQAGAVRDGPGSGSGAGLRALAAHLAEDPGRHLLALHADGRAVVASAGPDGAERVVTLIPGTGSSLEEIGRTAARAEAVCEAAEQGGEEGADGACVSVSWQGYDAPPDVAAAGFSIDRATAHAGDLRTFAAGLDAVEAMDGDDAPHAAVGYSYGSAVLGAAAADPQGLAADRMIHVGSPGAVVDSLAEQWVDEGGSARAAGERDVVGVVSRWDPVPWWSVTGVLGERPGSEEFGGLAVDVTEPGYGADAVRSAHSRYFDPGTVSLTEIGRLIADREEP